DADGQYRIGKAERLEVADGQFDLVVSYLTLIDIVDFRAAIGEMARVLEVGGSLLIANLTSFTSACAAEGWIRDKDRPRLVLPGRPLPRRIRAIGDVEGNQHRELASSARGLYDRAARSRAHAAFLPGAGADRWRRPRAGLALPPRALVRGD